MSSFVRTIESQAGMEYQNNPSSLDAPREVYANALKLKTAELETASSGLKKNSIENDICELYISLASMEIHYKQKKQANHVFKEAFKRDYCKKYAKLWKVYINFYIQEGLKEKARGKFKEAVENVDPSSEYLIWEFWVQFERQNGDPSMTIQKLKAQNKRVGEPVQQKSGISQIQHILTNNGMIDYNAMNEARAFNVRRDHRMMGLFQEPAPKLSDLRGSEEAPDIPNRILYYLGVVLTDPQVFELVSSLREIQHDTLMELDYAQELEYRGVHWVTNLGTITKKYQNIDISEEELKERYEQEMKATYSIESDRVSAMVRDFQEILYQAGVPGFCKTEDRYQLKIQRHILKLIELMGQERKEKKEAEERVKQMNLVQ